MTQRNLEDAAFDAFSRQGVPEPPMFSNVLIANRGEIACRIIRTAPRRSFGVRPQQGMQQSVPRRGEWIDHRHSGPGKAFLKVF